MRTHDRGAMPTPRGIEDVVISGTTAPDDWAERIYAGDAGSPKTPAAARSSPARPTDPGLTHAMKAIWRSAATSWSNPDA